MATFKERLWFEYPIPKPLSIWGTSPGVPAVESLDSLIEMCVEDVASDILIHFSVPATGPSTQMPEGTISCSCALLSAIYPFQGNRQVKVTYDVTTHLAFCRYYPSTIQAKRLLTLNDIDTLRGDRLQYLKAYVLWKMSDRELTALQSTDLTIDNGKYDLKYLEDYRNQKKDYYFQLKQEVMMYTTHN